MKNALKYLVLSISCVICFVMLVLMVALLLDIGSLTYPITLILPMISYALFIGGFVMLTVWAFKFSSNKAHKTFLIISLSIFLASTLVFISAKIVNPIISETETATEYFNFTPTELVNELEECLIDVTPMGDSETEDKTARVAAYASATDVFQTDTENISSQVHYQITYDDITGKASYISFFLSKDATKAHERYLYHIFSIASFIDGNINTDVLSDAISAGLSENDFAIFTGEKFKLHVTSSEEYLDATFTAIKN